MFSWQMQYIPLIMFLSVAGVPTLPHLSTGSQRKLILESSLRLLNEWNCSTCVYERCSILLLLIPVKHHGSGLVQQSHNHNINCSLHFFHTTKVQLASAFKKCYGDLYSGFPEDIK